MDQPIDRLGLAVLGVGEQQRARFAAFLDPRGLVCGGRAEPCWLPSGDCLFVDGAGAVRRASGRTGAIEYLHDTAPDGPFTVDGRAYVVAGEAVRPVGPAARTYARWRYLDQIARAPEAASPDGRRFAAIVDGNVVLHDGDAPAEAVTFDTGRVRWVIDGGRAKMALQAERQIVPAEPWSPDGRTLFAVRVDSTGVFEIPVIDHLGPLPSARMTSAPPAGGMLDQAAPYLIDASGIDAPRQLTPIAIETRDCYFALIGWWPDEVVFARYNRVLTRVDVFAADIAGCARLLLTETDDAFLANQHEVLFGGETHARLLPDDSGLLWRSARTGVDHFYRYDRDGALLNAVTEGDCSAYDVEGFAGEDVLVTAHADRDRPYDLHLCRAKLAGGALTRLTRDGRNRVFLAPDGGSFVTFNSRHDRAPRTELRGMDGTLRAVLAEADTRGLDAAGGFASEEAWTEIGGDRLRSVILRPDGFDADLSYPVIEWIYAGPQVAIAPAGFDLGDYVFATLPRALTRLGFAVVMTDGHGTPHRSRAFHQAIAHRWGTFEIAEHARALRALATDRPWLDLDRVGIAGHSWGGYYAFRALAEAPDLYRAAVASGPAHDPAALLLSEPYLGLPADDPDAYVRADNLSVAARVRGALLMVVGTSDWSIYSQTLRVSHRLIALGVNHDLLVLPGAGHGYGGVYDDWFVRALVRHFVTHLRPDAT